MGGGGGGVEERLDKLGREKEGGADGGKKRGSGKVRVSWFAWFKVEYLADR